MKRGAYLLILLGWLAASANSAAQQLARISGTVTDEQGNPIAGARVEAENPVNLPSLLSTTTDAKGRFAFGGVNVGDWKLRVTADGYHSYEEAFRAGVRANVRKEIRLKRATGAALLATSEKARKEATDAQERFEAGDYDGAIQLYRELLAKVPEIYQIHFNIALSLERKQDLVAAVSEYRLFLEKEPEQYDANFNLANILVRSGRHEEAIPYYEKCTQIARDNAVAFFNLGLALFQTKQADAATSAFERALAVDPKLADAHFMLGNIHLGKGDTAKAREHYERFLELAPDAPNAAAAREALAQLKP